MLYQRKDPTDIDTRYRVYIPSEILEQGKIAKITFSYQILYWNRVFRQIERKSFELDDFVVIAKGMHPTIQPTYPEGAVHDLSREASGVPTILSTKSSEQMKILDQVLK